MNQTSQPTVILGGGFVGLLTALHLSHQNYPHSIILIDRRYNFTFKPLLYELLSGEMHFDQICPNYADLLEGSGVKFVPDTIESIDLHQRSVVLESGKTYHYGKLVLAMGSKATYFHTPGAMEHALPFTSGEEALALSRRLKDNLNRASQTPDRELRRTLTTAAIIGAGPAGVELACTLADLMPIWYAESGGNPQEVRVVLINRSDEILKGDINSSLRDTAKIALQSRTIPVEIILSAAVTEIKPDGVKYKQRSQEDFLSAHTIAWTAGTKPHAMLMALPIPTEHKDKRGRLQVSPTLQLLDFPDVFAAGDCAFVDGDPQPSTAQVAYQQGKAIAHNLKALSKGHIPSPAHVILRGTLMKLGLGMGVANIFDRVEIKGKAGHLIRQATYLELLPTPIRNLKVTAEWLTDEVFQRHQPHAIGSHDEPEIDPEIDVSPDFSQRRVLFGGVVAIAAGLILALPLTLRAANPVQFHQNLEWSGIPVLLDRLAPAPPKSNS